MTSGQGNAAESQRIIEAGGLPPAAAARLQENAARQGTSSHLFTCNFSVNELLLTHQCGYEPLGQVMGTCVYHVGWQYALGGGWNWYVAGQELDVMTAAYRDARNLAFSRLRQEAAILKADGVVGVRLIRTNQGLDPGAFEFQAIGTAVRKRGTPPVANAQPFLSNLNGQDHWALRQMGMAPIGFVFGNCVWYQLSSYRNMNAMWGNAEMPDYTQAMYQAREMAMGRLENELRQLRSLGAVGVTVESWVEMVEAGQNQSALVIVFTAFGTAIGWDVGREPNVEITQNVVLGGTT